MVKSLPNLETTYALLATAAILAAAGIPLYLQTASHNLRSLVSFSISAPLV